MVVKTLKKTLSKGSQIFKGLCTPAKIETVLNIIGLISIIIACTVPSGSSMKVTCWSALPYIVISVVSVIILDALCKHGFGFISWMSVLTPIIVIIFLSYFKSLEEAEGFEDYSDDDEDFDDDEEDFDDDEELFEDEEDFGLVGDLKKKAAEAIAKAKAAQEAAKAAEQEQAPAAQEPAAQEPAAQENPQAPEPTKEDRINRLRKNISTLEKKLEKCSDERKQKLEKLIEKRQARLEQLENATEETEESSDNSAEAFRNFGRISL